MTTPICGHKHDGWTCTRPEGHTGDHIAGWTVGAVLWSWPQAQTQTVAA